MAGGRRLEALGQNRGAEQATNEEGRRERQRPTKHDPNHGTQHRTVTEVTAGRAGDRQGDQDGRTGRRDPQRRGKDDDGQDRQSQNVRTAVEIWSESSERFKMGAILLFRT